MKLLLEQGGEACLKTGGCQGVHTSNIIRYSSHFYVDIFIAVEEQTNIKKMLVFKLRRLSAERNCGFGVWAGHVLI